MNNLVIAYFLGLMMGFILDRFRFNVFINQLKLKLSNEDLIRTKDALWGEMQLAKKIQTVLLPDCPVIKRYDITGHMTPAEEVGGDYYDIINGKDVDWTIIGDVSGHGVSAGLVMMMVQTSIQAILRSNPQIEPSVLLKFINRAIHYNITKLKEDKYMTITALGFYKNGRVVFSGLHQDLLIYRSQEKNVVTIETDGMWIGIVEDLDNFNRDFEFIMNPGDVLLLFTDGITEATDRERNMFGDTYLRTILQKNGTKSSEEIKDAILAALEGYTCNDDVTMVVIKRLN